VESDHAAAFPDATARPVAPKSLTDEAAEEASDTPGTAEGEELADGLVVAIEPVL
jgi:hypothetical protein